MNYMAVLQELATSKKVNVAGGSGAIILALPTLVKNLSMSGDPALAQILLGILALGYVLIQGHIDAKKETERIQALRQFSEFAITKGTTPGDLVDMLRKLDEVFSGTHNPMPTTQDTPQKTS